MPQTPEIIRISQSTGHEARPAPPCSPHKAVLQRVHTVVTRGPAGRPASDGGWARCLLGASPRAVGSALALNRMLAPWMCPCGGERKRSGQAQAAWPAQTLQVVAPEGGLPWVHWAPGRQRPELRGLIPRTSVFANSLCAAGAPGSISPPILSSPPPSVWPCSPLLTPEPMRRQVKSTRNLVLAPGTHALPPSLPEGPSSPSPAPPALAYLALSSSLTQILPVLPRQAQPPLPGSPPSSPTHPPSLSSLRSLKLPWL